MRASIAPVRASCRTAYQPPLQPSTPSRSVFIPRMHSPLSDIRKHLSERRLAGHLDLPHTTHFAGAAMKAIQFNSFGGPEVLNLVDLPTPVADADSAIVQVKAASVNPSDVKNLSGHFDHTTLPRTPGRDFSGVVVEGPAEWIGAEVWGTG